MKKEMEKNTYSGGPHHGTLHHRLINDCQYSEVIFKVFGGASIGFASHKTTVQNAPNCHTSHQITLQR